MIFEAFFGVLSILIGLYIYFDYLYIFSSNLDIYNYINLIRIYLKTYNILVRKVWSWYLDTKIWTWQILNQFRLGFDSIFSRLDSVTFFVFVFLAQTYLLWCKLIIMMQVIIMIFFGSIYNGFKAWKLCTFSFSSTNRPSSSCCARSCRQTCF